MEELCASNSWDLKSEGLSCMPPWLQTCLVILAQGGNISELGLQVLEWDHFNNNSKMQSCQEVQNGTTS